MYRLLLIKIRAAECIHYLLRRNLSLLLRDRLYDIGKLLMHSLRQLEAEVRIHDKGDSSLARL